MSDEAAPTRVHEWRDYLAPRIEAVMSRLADAGASDVALLPVSKSQPIEAIHAAVELGLRDLGENYAQELAAKAAQVSESGEEVRWHFIGQLQSNKVRQIAHCVTLWQSIERPRIAREVAKRAPGASALVQVNLSQQEHKGGCSFDEVEPLVALMVDLGLNVDGLMGVGEAGDVSTTASQFTRLRATCDQLGLGVCSMGMSADLELAVECGSTMVRIGSDIFGPRRTPTE